MHSDSVSQVPSESGFRNRLWKEHRQKAGRACLK